MHSLRYPGANCIDQNGLELIKILLPQYLRAGIKSVFITMPGWMVYFLKKKLVAPFFFVCHLPEKV